MFFPADHPGVFAPRGADPLGEGVLKVSAGPAGCVFWGPCVTASAGVHRAFARTRAEGGGEDAVYFEVYADGRVHGARHFQDGCELIVRLPDACRIQFRFITASGVSIIHEGVEFEPVLLDREVVTVAALEALILKYMDSPAAPEALFHLIERLARMGEPEAAEAWRNAYVAGRGRNFARARATWIAINTPGVRRLAADLTFDLTPEQLAGFVESLPIKTFDIAPINNRVRGHHEDDELVHRGYKIDFLQATALQRDLHRPRRSWQVVSTPNDLVDFAPVPPMIEALRNVDLSFQEQVARGEGMSAYCPVSGRALRSTHGFCHHSQGVAQTLYRFEGVEVFYVLTGNFPNSRMLIFMPRTSTLVHIEEQGVRHYPHIEIVREFIVKILQYRTKVMHYLSSRARPAAVLGLNNIGHFFWNELSGLQFSIDSGAIAGIDQIVTVPVQYIDYRLIFPEMDDVPSVFIENPHDVFGYFVNHGLTPVRFTDALITPTLFERVRRVAGSHSGPKGSPPSDGPRPLIWINLRAQNKVWVGQASGYAEILNAIHEEYGNAAALLQGMPDCAEIAAEIRRLTHPEVALYDGINLDIYDKLNWAGHVDAYICVAGAGMAFTTWLADQHGVAHSEHGHLEHLDWWPYVRPEAVKALAPPKAAVKELGEGWYCNYEVDWRLLLDLLRQALSDREKQRGPLHRVRP